MKKNLKKMFGYYKPYMHIFWADMFFALLSALVALTIPLVVRYVTNVLVYLPREQMLKRLLYIAVFLAVLLLIDLFSRFFIGN